MLNADCTCGCETFCYFREYITGTAAEITVTIAINKKNEPTPKIYGSGFLSYLYSNYYLKKYNLILWEMLLPFLRVVLCFFP